MATWTVLYDVPGKSPRTETVNADHINEPEGSRLVDFVKEYDRDEHDHSVRTEVVFRVNVDRVITITLAESD